jgi:DNA polymerase III delta prime subunit
VPDVAAPDVLTERFRPRRLEEVAGNPGAIAELRRWATGWAAGAAPPALRAAVLEGRPGVGKTTAAWALARDMGWGVVEMNASEARNRTAIEQIAGRASLSNAFGDSGEYVAARAGGRTLILLDEADCLSGRGSEEPLTRPAALPLREFLRGRYGSVDALARAWGLGVPGAPAAFARWSDVPATAGRGAWTRLRAAASDIEEWKRAGVRPDLTDRGGLGAIAALVRSTRQPVILTVNDPQPLVRYSPIFRHGVARIRFEPVEGPTLRAALRRVILHEGMSISAPALDVIVRRSGGDLRAALTDLEAIGPLPAGPSQLEVLGGRDRASDFVELTREVLDRPRYFRSVEVSSRLDATPDDLLPWIEENAPRATPDPVRRYAAVGALARAELFLARARRERIYSLWSYATELMTGGVSDALARDPAVPLPEPRFPSFLAAMGRSRAARQLRRAVLSKLGPVLHLSIRKGNSEALPFLFRAFDPPGPGFRSPAAQAVRAGLLRRARLSPEEVGYLLGREPDSALVSEELARAEAPAPPAAPTGRRSTARTRPAPVEAAPAAPSSAPSSKRTNQKRLAEY